jgi:hypothetical protein
MAPHVSLALVVNPAARGVRRRYLRGEPFWRACLPEAHVRVTRTLEDLDRVVAEFREAGIRAVAMLGGDGSLHRLAEALFRHYDEPSAPIVLALAGGTMNGLARSLGSGGRPEHVLRAALAAVETGGGLPVRARYLLRVTDILAGRTHHGFGFAAGLAFRAFQEYYRRPEPGVADALRASLLPVTAALCGGAFYRGPRLEVLVEGAPWLSEPVHTVVASVTDNPFLWFRPFGAPLGDAPAFHLAATGMRPRELAPRLWSIFRGRCRHPRLRVGHVREARVRGESGYVIDGDRYPADGAVELDLAVGPRLRFLASPGRIDAGSHR